MPIADRTGQIGDMWLVAEARNGDHQAFMGLVSRYEARVFRLACQILQDREEAEEVLQGSFLKAYDRLGDLEPETTFRTWLIRIAVDECLAKHREQTPDSNVAGPHPPQAWSREHVNNILDGALRHLTPVVRAVLTLRDIEEFSVEEISAMLDVSVAVVKRRLTEGRMALRKSLLPVLRYSAAVSTAA